MKTLIMSALVALSLATPGSSTDAAPVFSSNSLTPGTLTLARNQVSVPGVIEVDKATLLDTVAKRQGFVVVEFYDSTSPDTSGECARQGPALDRIAGRYAGQVAFLRFDIARDRAFAEALRVTVCPSFLFLDHNQPEPNRLSKRHWGYLSEAQLEELLKEYFRL